MACIYLHLIALACIEAHLNALEYILGAFVCIFIYWSAFECILVHRRAFPCIRMQLRQSRWVPCVESHSIAFKPMGSVASIPFKGIWVLARSRSRTNAFKCTQAHTLARRCIHMQSSARTCTIDCICVLLRAIPCI